MNKSHGALRKSAKNCAVGGPIKGKGTGTSDQVPIMASNGEFMIKAKAVKAIGLEVLEALNAIADKPDEKDSKAEAMREYGDGSESPVHEKAEDKLEGMKCGGAVRKMAGGGSIAKEMATGIPHMEAAGYVDEAEKRAQLLAQIPTGGAGVGPTPQPDPTQSASGTDFGRNVNNSLNALGGMGVVASVPLKGTQAASSAIRGAINAPPVLQNSIPRLAAPAAQAVPDFVAGSSGVAKVGGANLPAISSMTPVSKVTNVALQEGAMANQMAGNARTLGNASAGLGALDQRQTTPAAEPAAPQSDYARQMSEMGASAMRGLGNIGQAAKTMALTAVSAPGYGLSSNNPTAPADASPYPSMFDGSPKAPTTPAPQGTPAAAVQPVEPVQKPAGALPSSQPSAPTPTATPKPGGDIPTPAAPANVQGTDGKSYLPGVVSSQDRIQSDTAINSVMGRRGAEAPIDLRVPAGGGAIRKTNADANIDKLASDGSARDTVNAAWSQRGAGIQAVSDGKGGLTLTNSTAPEKMQYTDMQGKPTNDYKATNQYAEGMAQREKLLESSKGLPTQYEKEVAGAQAVNEAGRRMNLEYDLKNGNLQERRAAKAILGSIDATEKDKRVDATTQRGQNITSRGQELQAGALRQTQKLAQDKFGLEQAKDGRESAASAMDLETKQQLKAAQQEYLNAGDDPVKQKAAERKLMALGNRQGKAPTFHPGSRIKNVDGSETVTPAYVFDPNTGQAQEVGAQGKNQSKAAPPAKAVEMLKANPKLAAEFDAKYGQGASAQFLAKK